MSAPTLGQRVDLATVIVFLACAAVIAAGGTIYTQFLSPGYLLQQLHNGAFMGFVVAGLFVVILLGRIDLSAPWTMTAAAMAATTLGGTGIPEALALPVGLAVGAGIGAINGFGVVVLKVPSIIWTLAVNTIVKGVIVYWTAQRLLNSHPSSLIETLGQGQLGGGISWALTLWLLVSLAMWAALRKSFLGRYLFAIGQNGTAAYLSGLPVQATDFGAFVFAGICNALAGILLAGYAGQAYMEMGTPYLLSAIAAVVIGGSSILGGKGAYAGAVGGAILVTLLTSLLSIAQMSEAMRQIVFGGLILAMVLLYSWRDARP